MLLHRIPVIVSALAVLLGFAWAPYEHLHPVEGVQHAHMTPHSDDHHHDGDDDGHDSTAPASESHRDASSTVISVDSFLSTAVVRMAPPIPFEIPGSLLPARPTARRAPAEPSRPQSHDPPLTSRLGPRAPPLAPAF